MFTKAQQKRLKNQLQPCESPLYRIADTPIFKGVANILQEFWSSTHTSVLGFWLGIWGSKFKVGNKIKNLN